MESAKADDAEFAVLRETTHKEIECFDCQSNALSRHTATSVHDEDEVEFRAIATLDGLRFLVADNFKGVLGRHGVESWNERG